MSAAILLLVQLFSRCPITRAIVLVAKMISNALHSGSRAMPGEFRGNATLPPPITIYSLPDEILILIFRSGSQCTSPSSSISQGTLLSISHVSARWRNLALGSGELWSFLTITFPINVQELHRAKEWVHRSSSYPLNIVIDVRDPDWDFNEDSHPVKWLEMQATMGVILPAAERWWEIKVLADNWEPLHAFLYYTQHISVPFLRSLHLIRCNPYFAAPHQIFIPSGSRVFLPLLGGLELDQLMSVELEGVHVDWTSPALQGLTNLSLGYHPEDVVPTLSQFRDLLSSCPALDSFSLAGWGPKIDDDTLSSGELQQCRASIILPRLRKLEVGIMIPTYAVDLLSLLVIPSLESLTIDDITRYDPQAVSAPDFRPVFNFLSGQSSSLHSPSVSTQSLSSLTVMNLDPGTAPFHQFLQNLNTLRTLQIRNCAATTLQALAPSTLGTPCKHLGQLSVEACDLSVLIDTVSSRRAGSDISLPRRMEVIFQQDANNSRAPISPEIQAHLTQLDINVLPWNPNNDRQWRSYESDDSEALVAAILEERWDVAGTFLQQ